VNAADPSASVIKRERIRFDAIMRFRLSAHSFLVSFRASLNGLGDTVLVTCYLFLTAFDQLTGSIPHGLTALFDIGNPIGGCLCDLSSCLLPSMRGE